MLAICIIKLDTAPYAVNKKSSQPRVYDKQTKFITEHTKIYIKQISHIPLVSPQEPLLLTCFQFNPSMDK